MILPDLPGYGASPAGEGVTTIDSTTDALERMLVARGVERPAIVGFSLGAYRALALALRPRLQVTKLVLLAGFAGLDSDVAAQFKSMADLVRSGVDLAPVALQRFLSPDPSSRNAARVLDWMSACPRDMLAMELDAMSTISDLRDRLCEIEAPVVARVGSNDLATPPAWSQDVVTRCRAARLEHVPGVAHVLLVEDRDGTIASVRSALS